MPQREAASSSIRVIPISYEPWHGLLMERASSQEERMQQHRYGMPVLEIPFTSIAVILLLYLMRSGLLMEHTSPLAALIQRYRYGKQCEPVLLGRKMAPGSF